MAQRIKGLENTLTYSSPKGDAPLGNMLNSEIETDMTILEEEYLGDPTKSYDDILNGYKGSTEFHMSTTDYFRFQQLVEDRAARRDPAGGKFSITMTLKFPSGIKLRVTYEDLFFGPMPTNTGSRKDFIKGKISWACNSCKRVY